MRWAIWRKRQPLEPVKVERLFWSWTCRSCGAFCIGMTEGWLEDEVEAHESAVHGIRRAG